MANSKLQKILEMRELPFYSEGEPNNILYKKDYAKLNLVTISNTLHI